MGSSLAVTSPQELQQLIYQLRGELAEKNEELERARAEVAAARGALRSQQKLRQILEPLHVALQQVFGELPPADHGPDPAAVSPTEASAKSAVWESWKKKLPGRPAQIIDALLLHGQMNSTQIGIAVGMSRKNVPAVITKLRQAGLINQNGHLYSLKAL